METRKAKPRRDRELFFDKFTRGHGIDIGCGEDPLTPSAVRWDKTLGSGDATLMEGVPDNSYDYLYASHVLEHLTDYEQAIRNWWRILKPGGWLIVVVPHRDLYEKRMELPSRWNPDHKHFWMPVYGDRPGTNGLFGAFYYALGASTFNRAFYSLRVLDEGHTITDPDQHSDGEYGIEITLHKP